MPHLRKAVKTVYLHQVSSEQWEKVDLVDKEQQGSVGKFDLKFVLLISCL